MHLSMKYRVLFSIACCFLCAGNDLWADGFILNKLGTYVPEKEQYAYIEWEAGRERLYVATRAEASQGPALWVVPIPSHPQQVAVDPVDIFPHVGYVKPFVREARKQLEDAVTLTILLDTAGLFCPAFLGTSASQTFSSVASQIGSSGVIVHQHIEKMGLVLEVLTAQDPDALDRYLQSKEIGVRSKDITAMRPYFSPDFVFICAWPSDATQAQTARALRIDFASPRIYYPLRASQVYTAEIRTSIFVRGWARADSTRNIPGMRCSYVRGSVYHRPVNDVLRASYSYNAAPNKLVTVAPHTRVELPFSPQGWTDDLLLEPEAPLAIRAAEAIEKLRAIGLWLTGAVDGMVFLSLLPWALFPRAQRQWRDWLWAPLVGAALSLSLIVSTLVFAAWMRSRDASSIEDFPQSRSDRNSSLLTAGLLLLFPALALVLAILLRRSEPAPAMIILMLPLLLCLLVIAARELWKTGRRGVVFLGFVLLHLGINVTALIALDRWLAQY